LHQVPGHVDVVVFQKHEPPGKPRIVPQVSDFLDEVLARLVGGMGLAGKDHLDRPLRVVDQRGKPVQHAEEQVSPLVRGEAPGEADRERVGVEQRAGRLNRFVWFIPAAGLPPDAPAHKVQEAVLQVAVRFPQLARVDVVQALPDFGVAHPLLPVAAQHAVVQKVHRVG
jgi:hypothetical protein